jgi:branched-chain amino acid transport system ATP-binding protein
MQPPLLSVAGICKHFGGVAAIRDISFDVQAGEVLGMMGPNGAGKSTLLNLISGEHKPDSGTVNLKGHGIIGLSTHRICHLGIARTYQIPQPFVNLTALQNITVAAEYGTGLSKAAAESEALRILDMVDLLEKKDILARDLQAITLKRLELARALATGPTLLLLDEVLVEHVMRVMTRAVDRIIVMDKGTKIAEGPPIEVMENGKVIEAYLGESA